MNDSYQPEDIIVSNERSLKKLIRSITNSQGHFTLILVRCNYHSLREQIVQQLKAECQVEIRELHLSKSVKTLYTTIEANLGDQLPQALMIFGLELIEAIDQVLISTNQVREEFRKNFQFPIVIWVNDEIFQKLIRLIPDFKSWTGNSIKFIITPNDLLENLRQTTSSVFAAILNVGAGKFLDNASLNLDLAALNLGEIDFAIRDLQIFQQQLEPDLEASVQFLLGREADVSGDKLTARNYYEQSLAFWEQKVKDQKNISLDDLKCYGCLLWHLGLWWRQFATLHIVEHHEAYLKAKNYFQKCVEVFQQHNYPDLAAKFINNWGEALTRLKVWNELENVASVAIKLHQTYSEPIRLAYSYGLMAEVALNKSQWVEAKQYAELALQTNDTSSITTNTSLGQTINWEWENKYYQNLYLLLIAESQKNLNQVIEAIANLETACRESNPQHDPLLYIRILATLQSIYFEQGNYLEAFQVKLEQRSIEQQYGLRAFVGAGRLQSRLQVINPVLAETEAKAAVTQEIAASGRMQDVNRLVERISRHDHKLTVIYGQSGVGKSSLVQAGLLPALKQRAIDARDVVPVLLQVYTDWAKVLGNSFVESLEEVRTLSLPLFLDSMAGFIEELNKNIEKDLLTVLIFDQFEEFFFAYKDPATRKPFFEFISDCLNIPYVKIILSLREDYLHYLLECNRLTHLDVIDNNILDKKILYYLGNFSPQDARSVIQSLTESSQLYLEPSLIDELVRDLAGALNEVRPIELQVVGAQLQTEKITTLVQYQEYGPKEKLVGRFLEEVVKDCGQNNEQFAKLVLYLLTDENNTRPLKTRAELEADLALETTRLDLILKILVKSGLVFQVPGFPADRYQLVHDYLVPFVREQQSSRLIAELEKEREQRKLTEAKLNQVLKQQLKSARLATFTLTGLLAAIGGFAVLATVVGINLYLTTLSDTPKDKSELEQLVSAIKAGKRLQQLSIAAIPETKYRVVTVLNKAVYGVREVQGLEERQGTVKSLSFSPDGKMLASASDDKTVKVWSIDGKKLKDWQGHTGIVNSIAFNFDGKKLASASDDKTVKIWSIDNTPPLTLKGHTGGVTSVSFSPNNKLIASGSKDKTVKIWSIHGQEIKTLKGPSDSVIAVSFSPDGKFIASASKDETIRIWKLDGNVIKAFHHPINNYGTINIRFSKDSQNIIAFNEDGIKYYALDGTDIIVKSISPSPFNQDVIAANIIMSPNGKLFAYVTKNDEDNKVYIQNTNENSNGKNSVVHSDSVTYTSFSPDNKFLATASKDKTIKIWNLDRILSDSNEESKNSVSEVHFSRDSKTIVTTSKDNTVKLWKSNGIFLKTLKKYDSKPSFSLDGKTIETVSTDSIVNLWNLERHKPTRLQGSIRNLGDMSFSPDGKIIAAISENNILNLWREDGTLIKILKAHADKITEFEFSPNSKIIASISENTFIKLWRAEDGKLINTLNANINKINKVIFSPDSQIIASIDKGNVGKLWRSDGSLITTLSGHIDGINNVIFSTDSQIVISLGNDNFVNLWRRDGRLLKTLKGNIDKIRDVKISPNGNIIGCLNGSNLIHGIINLYKRDGQLLKSIDDFAIKSFEFSPDSSMIASINYGSVVKLWSLNGQHIVTLKGHNSEISNIVFSDDGNELATTSEDKTVKLWNINGELLRTFRGNSSDGNTEVWISYDNKIITAYSKKPTKQTINIWDRDGKKLRTIEADEVSFSPNREYITSLSEDRKFNYTVKLWSGDGKELKSFPVKRFTSKSFSPDGKRMALETTENYYWKRWRIDGSLLEKGESKGSSEWSNDRILSPDSKVIASISDDHKTVKLWRSDGAFIKALTGHNDKVNSVSFSPDGTMIASASDDKTVKLWKSNGTLIKTLVDHTDKVKIVKFSLDSKMIVSISGDNKIQIWSRDGTLLKTSNQFSDISDAKSVSFSPDGSLLGMIANSIPTALNLDIVNGYWFKGTNLHNIKSSPNSLSFSPDNKTIAIATDNGLFISSLDLDQLLSRACNWARVYLKNNPNVEGGDRNLCDDVK